ncbi:MAG TPA: class III extradiol ring-cleavage dioxygenase [Bacillus sp. (in: firmicutes)]|nr:class III extradiol ring-cleavage dioxygenase [Bacillus sp. (in: firmicutes)]
MMPSLFLAHGSPMLAIEQNPYTDFLENIGRHIKPKAIVIFTAHWESDITTISYTDEVYETIYDFYGFPDEMYTIKYPARGSKKAADMVKNQFQQQGIPFKLNMTRGLDHGSWTLLSRIYPNADIPVIQISVNPFLEAENQYKIGQSLKALRAEDILIIGSGVTVHNLRALNWNQTTPEAWAVEFDDWLIDKIQQKDLDGLFKWEESAPNARLAVPRPEHFVPFFIAVGSGDSLEDAKVIHRSYEFGTLSYLCFQF